MDILEYFANWYQSKCDGVWEHMHGIEISNIDNPGWKIEISGEDNKTPFILSQEEGEDNWIVINASDNQFTGYCSVQNLLTVLERAKAWTINDC